MGSGKGKARRGRSDRARLKGQSDRPLLQGRASRPPLKAQVSARADAEAATSLRAFKDFLAEQGLGTVSLADYYGLHCPAFVPAMLPMSAKDQAAMRKWRRRPRTQEVHPTVLAGT